MEASLAAFATGKVNACSDLGAAGVGAAVCESVRYGGLGAEIDLTAVPVKEKLSPEEILICETQARMLLQVAPQDVEEVLAAIRSAKAAAAVIGRLLQTTGQHLAIGGKGWRSSPTNLPGKCWRA